MLNTRRLLSERDSRFHVISDSYIVKSLLNMFNTQIRITERTKIFE